jgi:hypothetical protein
MSCTFYLEAHYGTRNLFNISIYLYITYILSSRVAICKPMYAIAGILFVYYFWFLQCQRSLYSVKCFLSFVNMFLKSTFTCDLIFLMLTFCKHFRSSSHFASEMSLRLTECRIKLVIITASLSADFRVRCLKWRSTVLSPMCIVLEPPFRFHIIT